VFYPSAPLAATQHAKVHFALEQALSMVCAVRTRNISPIGDRIQRMLDQGSTDAVFRDVQKSRSELGRIDYPEALLHPVEVLSLAEALFYKAVAKGRPIFVLTKSEHVVLRIMKCVRERRTFYSPDRVNVVVAHRVNDGLAAVPVPITEDGELGGPWPGGFFDERMKELV
jgi:hypothetical protein